MQTSMKTLAKCNWDGLEQDVVQRIRMLKVACQAMDQNALTDQIANDLILPSLRLLGEFCACVDIRDEEIEQ